MAISDDCSSIDVRTARIGIKTELTARIADSPDRLAGDLRNIDIGRRGDLPITSTNPVVVTVSHATRAQDRAQGSNLKRHRRFDRILCRDDLPSPIPM